MNKRARIQIFIYCFDADQTGYPINNSQISELIKAVDRMTHDQWKTEVKKGWQGKPEDMPVKAMLGEFDVIVTPVEKEDEPLIGENIDVALVLSHIYGNRPYRWGAHYKESPDDVTYPSDRALELWTRIKTKIPETGHMRYTLQLGNIFAEQKYQSWLNGPWNAKSLMYGWNNEVKHDESKYVIDSSIRFIGGFILMWLHYGSLLKFPSSHMRRHY